jgi:hypothetical protein
MLLPALSEGSTKYGEKSSDLQGNIVDALLSGLTEYKAEMVKCGKIQVVNQ